MKKSLVITITIVLLQAVIACRTPQTIVTPAIADPVSAVTPSATDISIAKTALIPTSTVNSNTCWAMRGVGNRILSGNLLYKYVVMDSRTGAPMASTPGVFNLQTGYTKGLENFLFNEVSPDGKMLAGFTRSDWVFLTEDGSFIYPIPEVTLQKDSTYMFLLNGKVLWEGTSPNLESSQNNGVARDMYVLSTYTGELELIQSIWLPHSLWKPSTSPSDYLIGIYSPDLKYVLYPATYQNTKVSILFNIQNQEIVWHGWPGSDLGFYRPPLPYYTIETPVWSPDSSNVIFHRVDEKTGTHNLYNLTIDGQVIQLTHLEKLFPNIKYIISSLSISPDGHYLAFALVQDIQKFPGRNSILLILDLKNGMIINPCITLANHPYPARPVWSPDSTAIAVVPDSGNHIAVVDINERVLFSLFSKTGLDAGSLIGWIDWDLSSSSNLK